jgi:sodium/potassium-transporting ATPase subunit alpha
LQWHSLSINDVSQRLATNRTNGLSSEHVIRKHRQYGKNIHSRPPSHYFRKVSGYVFGGFGFILIVAGILCCVAWRPLGEPEPQAANLALGIVLFIVAGVQACFNAWQVKFRYPTPLISRIGAAIE